MCKKTLIIMVLPLIVLAAEWQALNGPLTGLVEDMSIGWHEGIPGWVVYAADSSHKLYKSVNEGEYWDSIYTHDDVVYPTCVITRPSNAQIVYIGKYDATPVWWSEDGGQTWDERSGEYPNNITNENPRCFGMHPDYPDTVYTGFDYQDGDDCLYKTIDGGDNWAGCNITECTRDIWIHPGDPQILYIATADSIRKSTDCGASWTKLPAPSSDGYDTYCIAVNTDQTPEVLFVIIMDYQDFKAKIYKTTDDGQNWTLLYTFPDSPEYDTDLMPTGLEIDASTSGQNIYATIRPLGFYKSTNYGASWSASNDGIGDKHLYSLMQHPSTAGCLFAGGCMAVYKSTDYGAIWSEITKGFKIKISENIQKSSITVMKKLDYKDNF